jgi:mannose-6-phosphate isomerase
LNGNQIRSHLWDQLLPLWKEHGVDRARGGFFNQLTHACEPAPGGAKRLLVQLRQIHAFAQAHLDGAPDWTLETARHGWEFLRHYRDEQHGGWYLTASLAGEPLDTRKDCYAHAFVILALATLHRATGEREVLAGAEHALEVLLDKMRDPAGGFHASADEAWRPQAGARLQNPQMHLFEALLALHEASGSGLELARELLDLLRSRLVDERGCLFERFGADWEADPGAPVEPGHQFEWVWLLAEYARLSGDDSAAALADGMYAFGVRYGLDREHGGVFDELSSDGELRRDSKRLWPQTEHLHALALRCPGELGGPLALVFERYVDPQQGGWREHTDRTGRVTSTLMNATSVYHVYGSLRRVARALDGA